MLRLFLGAVVNHLLFSFGGVVLMIFAIIEQFRGKKTEAWIFWGLALACLFVASYGAWTDEHQNAQEAMYGKDGKSEAWSKYNQCDKERAVNDASAKSCSSNLTYQQSRNDGQQDLFNRCMLALGQSVTPQPLKVTLRDAAFATASKDKDGTELTEWILIATVNKSVSPFRSTLRCAEPIHVMGASVSFGNNAEMMTMVQGPYQISDREYRVGYVSPATWLPDTPVVFAVLQTQRPKGCVVTTN